MKLIRTVLGRGATLTEFEPIVLPLLHLISENALDVKEVLLRCGVFIRSRFLGGTSSSISRGHSSYRLLVT